jgi:membrane protein YdbS with pleckstrin-like domain
MTVYEFRTVAALKRSISILALTLAATGILSVIYFLLNSGGPLSLKLSGIATLLLSAVCCLFIYLIEKRIVYTRFLSPNKAPDESNQIAP